MNPCSSANTGSENVDKLSWRVRIAYSTGHVLNDLCAAVWFSYTLLYFQIKFNSPQLAGTILMIGQVVDALSTPLVGYQSDKSKYKESPESDDFFSRYGRRKIWHLSGTLLVLASFPFIYNDFFLWSNPTLEAEAIYFTLFIVVFQFAWACVQVTHVALINDLTRDSSERVRLNSYRQAATVASSLFVYLVMFLIVGSDMNQQTINKDKLSIFTNVVYILVVSGSIFSLLFHLFTPEKKRNELRHFDNQGSTSTLTTLPDDDFKPVYIIESTCSKAAKLESPLKQVQVIPPNKTTRLLPNKELKWCDWLVTWSFWRIGFIYMFVRLFINLTQVYTPLYLKFTLNLPNHSIATIPFVTYVSGFVVSILAGRATGLVGSKSLLGMSSVVGGVSTVWIYFGSTSSEDYKTWEIFVVATLFGVGGTLMLISSLALTSDMIGNNTRSSAFVFGAIGLLDKVINGLVVVLVQHFNYAGPDESTDYYRLVLSLIAGGAILATLLGLSSIAKTRF